MKNRTFSKNIADAINSFLTEDDWNYTFDDQRGLFKFNLKIKGRIKKVSYIIAVKDDDYIVYTASPLGADDDKTMAVMAEFICHVNYGVKNGNFELDMMDGEIRYKCFVDCEGITPSKEMIRNSIYCPAAMFNRYGPGIVDILFCNATAKEAVDKCEKSLAEALIANLGKELDGDADMDAIISRLAALFGIDEGELHGDNEEADADDETKTGSDPFGSEGGVA